MLISVKTGSPIVPMDLHDTLLRTQINLRRSILNHYHAEADILADGDNPYVSSATSTGCWVAIKSWPDDEPNRLTYGMVDIVLTGLWDAVYLARRDFEADALVRHDTLGIIGYAFILKERPVYPGSSTARM